VSGFEEAITAVIASLARGEVVTYGEVAAEAGYPGAARAVGSLLGKTDENLPWWRVVGSGGHLRSPDPAHQARLLSADGVLVVGGRVIGRSGREYPQPG
jgi:methylated-DNA-protein-cysteine methyltransferase related protein